MQLELDQGIFALTAIELIHAQFDPVAVNPAVAADDPQRPYAIGAVDVDDHPAGHGAEYVAEFAGEDARQVAALSDEIVVAVAAVGQLGHQVFVIVGADPDGGDRDPFLE